MECIRLENNLYFNLFQHFHRSVMMDRSQICNIVMSFWKLFDWIVVWLLQHMNTYCCLVIAAHEYILLFGYCSTWIHIVVWLLQHMNTYCHQRSPNQHNWEINMTSLKASILKRRKKHSKGILLQENRNACTTLIGLTIRIKSLALYIIMFVMKWFTKWCP